MKKSKALFCTLAFLGTLLSGCGKENLPTTSSEAPSTSEEPTSSVVEPTTSVTPTTSERNYTFASYANPTMVFNSVGSDYRGEVADPSIVRGDDGYFYVFATGGIMLRSEDACTFEVVTNSVIPTPTWWQDLYPNASGFAIWAPDVIKIEDKWIYYYSLSAWGKCCGVGYAVSDTIDGPYEDKGKLFDLNEIEIQNCIDPHVFIDDDGSIYMSVGSFQGLYLLELTDDGMGLFGGVEYQRDNKTLIAGKAGGWDGSTYEGSYIIKKDGYYYYFGSAGTCCEQGNSTYRVYVGKSDNIRGPYKDSKGFSMTMSGSGSTYGELVLWAGMSDEKDVVGTGHNSILRDDKGDYWIYYHAYSSKDNFITRHLFLDKLEWNDKGYPYVSYINPETETETKFKPSFDIELDGPCFYVD